MTLPYYDQPSTAERIEYRLERARTSLEEARLLAEADSWHGSLNRCYYACFYAAKALLAEADLEARTHDGTKTLFTKHFVKDGSLDAEWGRFYSSLYDERLKSDFDDLVDLAPDDIEGWTDRAESLLDAVDALVDDREDQA
jgi:uncharacterized protein (UPF0332 family)